MTVTNKCNHTLPGFNEDGGSETTIASLKNIQSNPTLTCSITILGETYTKLTEVHVMKILSYTPRAGEIGKNITLNCKVLDVPHEKPVTFSWFYNKQSSDQTSGELVSYGGLATTIENNEDFTISGGAVVVEEATGRKYQESLLTIKSLAKSDKYYCTVKSEDSSSDTEINVVGYCEFTFNSHLSTRYIVKNFPVTSLLKGACANRDDGQRFLSK